MRKELEVALKDLDSRKSKGRIIPASDAESSEECSPELKRIKSAFKKVQENGDAEPFPKRSVRELFKELGDRDVAVQSLEPVEEEFPNRVPPAWNDERLVKKYNDLVAEYRKQASKLDVVQKNNAGLSHARQKLEDKVRKHKESIEGFVHHTNYLNKKNRKLRAELASCPHGHRGVSELTSPNGPRRSGDQSDSDNEMILRPEVTPNASKSPQLPNPHFELPSLMPTSSPIKAPGGPNRRRLQSVPRDEVHHDSPAMAIDQPELEDVQNEGPLETEEMPPHISEDDLELPRLKDGSGNSPTQQSNHTSSTQGEPYTMQQAVPSDDSPPIKSEGDSPVLVETRRVPKPSRPRRANASNTAVDHTVKMEEIISSSPVGLAAMDYGSSQDLDDHPHMITPRKRKSHALPHRPSPSQLSILNEVEEDITLNPIHASRSSAILVERSPDKPSFNSKALKPMSSNKQLFRRIDDGQPAPKRQRRHASPTAIASLAEDGENFQEPTRAMREPRNANPGMLFDLLENPPSRSSVLSPGITPRTATSASRRHITPGTSPPSSRPSSRAGSKSKTGPFSALATSRLSRAQARPKIASSGDMWDTPSSSPRAEKPPGPSSKPLKSSRNTPFKRPADAPPHDRPDNEPLRCRPIAHLTLDDFKINPRYNQGYTHAFKEVVRKRDERRCLPGCERSCCGPQFRKLAEMTISLRVGPLTEAVRESDKRALMNYLGDDFPKYSKMNAEKKHETLVLAMARQIANDHGKHRHAYQRSDSPPGFWDVDFPGTQQIAANRAAASEAERLKVEARYREAMRPLGAYMFRDE